MNSVMRLSNRKSQLKYKHDFIMDNYYSEAEPLKLETRTIVLLIRIYTIYYVIIGSAIRNINKKFLCL